jgi:hypothetical protein
MDFDGSDDLDINEFFEVFRILDAKDGKVDGILSLAEGRRGANNDKAEAKYSSSPSGKLIRTDMKDSKDSKDAKDSKDDYRNEYKSPRK